MIKSVLFDLDGTLTDPFEGITNAILYALDKCGQKRIPREELLPFIGPPLMYSFKNYVGMTEEGAARAVAFYREYYSGKGIFELKLCPGMTEAMKKLKARGIKQYMATSKPEPFAVRISEKFGLNKYLDGVAGASFDSSRAEKDQVVAYAVDRFALEKAHTVMVGDRKYDVEGAAANGIPTIGVLFGYGSEDELKKAGAKHIAASAEEMVDIICSRF